MNSKKGMTLIEMVVAIAILGIVMLFFAPAVTTTISSYRTQKKVTDAKDVANQYAAILKDAVHHAKSSVVVNSSSAKMDGYACYWAGGASDGGSDLYLQQDGSDPASAPHTVFSAQTSFTMSVIPNSDSHAVGIEVVVDGYTLDLTVSSVNPEIDVSGDRAGNTLCVK